MSGNGTGASGFYALLFRQKYITRWGLMRNTRHETLAEHAAEVALLAHALCVIGNVYFDGGYDPERASAIALFHDVPEVFTGDLPTPVKYRNSETRKSYASLEQEYVSELIGKLPEPMQSSYRPFFSGAGDDGSDAKERKMVKIADKLCAYIKCVEECESGNRDFDTARKSTEKALDALSCPELDFFREVFLPAFGLTLDEQQ